MSLSSHPRVLQGIESSATVGSPFLFCHEQIKSLSCLNLPWGKMGKHKKITAWFDHKIKTYETSEDASATPLINTCRLRTSGKIYILLLSKMAKSSKTNILLRQCYTRWMTYECGENSLNEWMGNGDCSKTVARQKRHFVYLDYFP